MKIQAAEYVRSATAGAQLLRDARPEVAFVGRSNVGKSSLMNRLLGKKGLARTSSTPGRTQAVNYFLVNRRFYFVDLPGYGFAKAAKSARRSWAELMDAYFRQARSRTLLVQLVDGNVGATDLDRQAHEYLASLGMAPLVVATKIDKVPRGRWQQRTAAVRQRLQLTPGDEVIPVSAITGEGVKPLWNDIKAFLGKLEEKPQ